VLENECKESLSLSLSREREREDRLDHTDGGKKTMTANVHCLTKIAWTQKIGLLSGLYCPAPCPLERRLLVRREQVAQLHGLCYVA